MPASVSGQTSTTVPLSKYHSYGNDFLIADGSALPEAEQSVFSAAACHRYFGIGADGCIFVTAGTSEDFSMVLYNQDGSLASMSGNGGRCACTYLHHKGRATRDLIPIRSSAGLRHFTLLEASDGLWRYRSAMGEPDFSAGAIPAAVSDPTTQLIDVPIDVSGRQVRVTALWVGNPQCVLLVDELPDEDDFTVLGGGLTTHDFFPEGTNVGFVRVDDSCHLTLKVWERGVGPTWSSGTGSCAGAVVAIQHGLVDSPVTVTTETGSQQVQWAPGEQMYLEGDTRFVADCHFHWQRREPSWDFHPVS